MQNNFSNSFPGDEPPHHLVAGRYRFLSSLGQGGMGRTDRYWDTLTGRPVVIKWPRPEFIEKPGFLERFDREVRLMQAIVHPHVVPIADSGIDEGLPFFVMPFLPGGSLSIRRLRDAAGSPQPNHPSMLHLWLPGIAAALDHVHAGGVVHRDVKPANIFFNAFWHSCLGDFGVAKVVDETGLIDKEQTLTGTHVAVGTELYMGPELFSPKPTLTGAVDQYALAVMVYELLCGRRPFVGDTAHLIVEVTTKQPPPLDRLQPGLPPRLVQAVHRGLAKRPAERFPICSEFAAAVLADVPPMAPAPDEARLACPSCSHLIKIATSDAGKRGRCPKCRKRLVIAADLAALWTRDEETIVAGQPAAPWPQGDEATPMPPSGIPEEESGPVFKPLSRPTPLPRRKRTIEQQRLLFAIGLALVNVAAIAAAVWFLPPMLWPPRPEYRLEREGRLADERRVQVFPPVGWKQADAPLNEGLVVFEPKNGKRVPRIRVIDSARPPAAPRLVLPIKLTTRVRNATVNGRTYSVEVTAAMDQAEDAEKIAKVVAGGMKEAPSLDPVPQVKTGLKREFFRDRNLRHKVAEDVWRDVDAEWVDAPLKDVPRDNFSVRWSGAIRANVTGPHIFQGVRDNGLRLTINGRRIIDEWNPRWGDYKSEPIQLLKDKWYPIEIEFFDADGRAMLTLEWKPPYGPPELVPTECLRPTLGPGK
jgi:serine/threonine protein kinase